MSATIIAKARAHCAARDLRFTPLREKVYALMLEKLGPMGAYELLDELKESEPKAKPATIYRILDFLLEIGFIHRLESTNAFVACQHFNNEHPVQFLICDNCGYAKEIHSEGIAQTVRNLAESHGFEISTQTIEAHGICNKCKQ